MKQFKEDKMKLLELKGKDGTRYAINIDKIQYVSDYSIVVNDDSQSLQIEYLNNTYEEIIEKLKYLVED